ncbi:hypothetical protein [Chelativorans sp. Marseille-P2723]|uniref:hypothetical protein n=1 Tax=Chelativorans sp. Marseille-P2723 TaxID=2709133 RepID=UPI00156F5205|nr:hypothetical protein [Chelativorans sp. Marseille-P2723]
MLKQVAACCGFLAAFFALPALAQDEETISFSGGEFTITENADLEKVLSFEGAEIASDYVLYYNRTVELGGVDVALFEIGPGGNACGTATLIIWKPEAGDLQTAQAGDDCGSPHPAISEDAIYFVPYLLPGESRSVERWSSEDGLRTVGDLAFAPQPGTSWADLDSSKLNSMINAFANEAVYDAAKALLQDELTDLASGLIVSDGVHTLQSGTSYGSGCVPHACGSSNAFMAIDQAGQKLYFAQQDGAGGIRSWPDPDAWPKDVYGTMTDVLASN